MNERVEKAVKQKFYNFFFYPPLMGDISCLALILFSVNQR